MNSTEPDVVLERGLVLAQHFCGTILLLFNGSVIILIILDDDIRNKHYRKYLCCLQLCSLAFDTFSDFYAPIFLMHRGLLYSDSFLSNFIGIGKFMTIELVLLAEVVLSYFACVYYRRALVLGPERRFNYTGWRRAAILLFVQIYGLTAVAGMVYFTAQSHFLPDEHAWVRNRTAYMFMLPDENAKYATYASAPIADSVALAAIAMLAQLVHEVKTGTGWISASTRKYQRLAVRSLILQGAVPSLLYVVPSYANTCLQFAPTVFDCGARFNRFANVLSPILWITICKHTFASSLTILYCAPSYRRKIISIITRRSDFTTPQSHAESTRDSEKTR